MSISPYQPQFYDHQTALQPALSSMSGDKYVVRTKNQAYAARAPEDYLLLWDLRIKREERYIRKLIEMYVTMHRRFRGVSISDQFGYFGTRPETQGRWIDYDPEEDGEVHPINIVRPDIKANVAALLQVNVGIDCEAANQDARYQQSAERIQYLIDFFERDTWSEADRTFIFDAIQKEGTVLVETLMDRNAGSEQTVPRSIEEYQHFAAIHCPSCKIEGVKEIGGDETQKYDGKDNIPCPNCGKNAMGMVKTLKGYNLTESKIKTGEISHRFHSGFNFIIDRKGARTKGIQSAKWLSIRELVDRAELEDTHPQFNFEAPLEWSYALKCQHALEHADWSMLYSGWQPTPEATEWDLFQRNTHFIHESVYRNYVAPSDWEFRGSDGKRKFSIKRGETWCEAVYRSTGKGVNGFRFITVNDRIVDIQTPPDFEPNFRKCFSDIHFQRDSGSFLSVPHWDSAQLQDDATLFNTLKTEITARNSVEPVYFNSEIFDLNDFGKEYVPSKDGALDPDAGDIRTQVTRLPIAKAADNLTEHLAFILGPLRNEISAVASPALKGESQPGQPYAAQRQQLEQSMGMLTPASKSYAQMKVMSTKQKLVMAFEHWTLEQFQAVATRFGEKWSESDVSELVATDLERDVIIDYVPGTEVPQGNLTKELKFFNALQQIMPFIEAGVIAPPIITQILKRIDEFADFDFDLSGAENTDALAQKRYGALSDACAPYDGLPHTDIEQLRSQVVAHQPPDADTAHAAGQAVGMAQANPDHPDSQAALQTAQAALEGTPITAYDLLSEEILHEADIYISPTEDVNSQKTFFGDQIVRELAKPVPNYLLVEIMQDLVGQFTQILSAAQQQALANDPTLNAQKDAAREQADQERQTEQQKAQAASAENDSQHQRELQKIAAQEAAKENDRDFQREQAANELMNNEADRRSETTPPPAEFSRSKMIESINIKDLPVEGQQQLAAEGGIELPLSAFQKKAEDDKPAPKTPPAKPAPKKK